VLPLEEHLSPQPVAKTHVCCNCIVLQFSTVSWLLHKT
jgi:hypothetical protein